MTAISSKRNFIRLVLSIGATLPSQLEPGRDVNELKLVPTTEQTKIELKWGVRDVFKLQLTRFTIIKMSKGTSQNQSSRPSHMM